MDTNYVPMSSSPPLPTTKERTNRMEKFGKNGDGSLVMVNLDWKYVQ
jgi:hypothetical protein